MTAREDGGHSLGRLSIEAEVADLDLAMRVRPVLETQAVEHLAGPLERVLDALDPGGLVRIVRLDIDLGTLHPDRLEAELGPAFEAALRAALAERLAMGEAEAVEPWENADRVYVANSGLALFTPFLPRLFERLGLLSDVDGRPTVVGEAATRAVNLLQYLVDGRTDAPEPELVLNKLLCGLAPEQVVRPLLAPDFADMAICDEVLQAVIGNWRSISGTSAEALRETFLRREGRLTRGEAGWSLTVQRKTVDILVDQLPWSIGMVFHRWMSAPISVSW